MYVPNWVRSLSPVVVRVYLVKDVKFRSERKSLSLAVERVWLVKDVKFRSDGKS